ncbi:hypothetical protein [Halpernia frigidisoli]|uniref:Uncharacterized protein n=1 Tax=Halpernia frigidisoli TaxID=1125876 RepID=A0A1I3FG88_9FLAO|nr:hypothetical protein [Halpernia frigidisoli]SFI10214.1 hypothetical protein SAMN05443292_1363 [Halpernia frigidisoli]
MIYKLLISNLFFISLINCQTQKVAQNTSTDITKNVVDVKSENLIYLKEGETKFIKELQANITFVGITEDSRCPEGVNCIWAGAATANLTVMTTTSRPMQMQLSTVDMPSRKLIKANNIGDFHVILDKVSPYPNQKINKSELKGKYEIVLKMEKGNIKVDQSSDPVTTK